MKKILMCIPEGEGTTADRFEMKVIGVAGHRMSCVCRDMESLESELRKPWTLYSLVILYAGTDEDLEQFISFQELLEAKPVLMVLSGSSPDICKRAHLLRPRFISFSDGDFSDFAAVLQKMILNQEGKLPQTGEEKAAGD